MRRSLTGAAGYLQIVTAPMLCCALTASVASALPEIARSPTRAADRSVSYACAHHAGSVGLIGYETLIERGWTIGETNGLGRALNRFVQRVCPQPRFIDVEAGTYRQKHVDNMSIWQDKFRVLGARGHHYWVTADLPSLDSMTVTIRSVTGTLLYRSGRISTPEG
jgi:hypothetical protein